MIAAGDSYSSGEGVFGNTGPCAQSSEAYGPSVVTRLRAENWRIEPFAFTACTGHLVEDEFNPRPGAEKGSLWDWAIEQGVPRGPGRVDAITLSYGGNDIGFPEVINDCVVLSDSWQQAAAGAAAGSALGLAGTVLGGVFADLTGCDTPEKDLRQRIDSLLNPSKMCLGGRHESRVREGEDFGCDLLIDANNPEVTDDDKRGSIVDFYGYLLDQHLTERGHLFIVGYPSIFAPTGEWPLWSKAMCAGITRGDAGKLQRMAGYFNEALRRAVEQADDKRGRIHYLSRYELYRNGAHELCGKGKPWLNSIASNRDAGPERRWETSFHPNSLGHAATADLVQRQFKRAARSRTGWLGSKNPTGVTLGQLRNAPVPSMCDYPAGTLVDGKLPVADSLVDGKLPGAASFGVQVSEIPPVIADLDADGVNEGVMAVTCISGENTDVYRVFAYAPGPKLISEIPFRESLPENEGTWPPVPLKISVTSGDIELSLTFWDEEDSHFSPSLFAYRRFRLNGRRIESIPLRAIKSDEPLRMSGWGPVRPGMDFSDVARASGLTVRVVPHEPSDESCVYIYFEERDGVVGLGGDGKLGALSVSSYIKTAEGIGIGSAQTDVESAYRGRFERRDNTYSDVDDIYVVDPNLRDSGSALRFVISESSLQVTNMYAGLQPWVSLAEGCS